MAEQNLVLNRVGVFSVAKVSGFVYAAIGLLVGMIFSFFALIGTAFGIAGTEASFGIFFGVGAVVVLPIFYGVLGFIGGAIFGLVYNLVAGAIGGVEVELK